MFLTETSRAGSERAVQHGEDGFQSGDDDKGLPHRLSAAEAKVARPSSEACLAATRSTRFW